MSRPPQARIADILDAIHWCKAHRSFLADPATERLANDAIQKNLSVIGEAINHLPEELLSSYPEIPWRAIVGLRNLLVHQYFGVSVEEINEILDSDLPELEAAMDSLKKQLET